VVKTWISYYSHIQEELKNYCSELKDMGVMVVCLRHVKTIVRDQFFFTDFVYIHGEGG